MVLYFVLLSLYSGVNEIFYVTFSFYVIVQFFIIRIKSMNLQDTLMGISTCHVSVMFPEPMIEEQVEWLSCDLHMHIVARPHPHSCTHIIHAHMHIYNNSNNNIF